jgi:hypothetical protein
MDLIGQGRITGNPIEPSYELVDTFNTYWAAVMPPGATTSTAYLFPHLRYPLVKLSAMSQPRAIPSLDLS